MLLSEPEKQIVKVLEENDVLTQKQISIKTNIAKSTLSRWVKKLEGKNIVVVSDSNHYKNIKLSEWFKKS